MKNAVEISEKTPPNSAITVPLWRGLSARLLLLAILFVMISEVFLYAPSISRYREAYLQEQLDDALLALAAVESTKTPNMAEQVADQLLERTGAYLIAVHYVDVAGKKGPRMMLSRRTPHHIHAEFNLMTASSLDLIYDAFECLFQSEPRVLRILGSTPKYPSARIEVVIWEAELQREMFDYSSRILLLSVMIAVITAALLFFALQWIMVRPMRHLTDNVLAFGQNPEKESSPFPSRRSDEIGAAQRALVQMQGDLRGALLQKTRLAAIGIAVTKFNHDLRNILASAMLFADRLSLSQDDQTQRSAEKLITIIERATDLCQHSLKFAKDGAPEINRQAIRLSELMLRVQEDIPLPLATRQAMDAEQIAAKQEAQSQLPPEATLSEEEEIRIEDHIEAQYREALVACTPQPQEKSLYGDIDQLHRAFGNLLRNAIEAGAHQITIAHQTNAGYERLHIIDDGPGLPEKAKEYLFLPFQGSVRKGGTGLGLAIAKDIVTAHGGNLTLLKSDSEGTIFELTLPSAPKT